MVLKAPLTVDDGDRLAARASGVSRSQLAELRAGRVRVDATLDLHGATVERGLVQLRRFLADARAAHRRCVLVIHGKGSHSDPAAGAPLREAVVGELLGPSAGLVHALAAAAPRDGGDGATYVMLRSAA